MISFVDVETLIYTEVTALQNLLPALQFYPSNFVLKGGASLGAFARISVVFGASGNLQHSVDALLVLELFTKAGEGTHNIYSHADVLNTALVGKFLVTGESSMQFHSSTLQLEGTDHDNFSYHKTTYKLPFTLKRTR